MAVAFAAAAFASTAVSTPRFFDLAHRMRHDYAHMSETQRDETTVEAVGLPAQTWEFIRGHVKPRDRYVIETPDRLGEGFHRFMQTVAGYWLLPAVATTDAHAADVLVYLGERGPRGASCAEAPQLVCVLGHGR